MFRRRHRTWSFHFAVLQRTAKKCTKIYNARAQLLFCSLNLLFSNALVAVVVVVCLSSLLPVRVLACSCHLRKEALRPLEQSASRLSDNHKTSPNDEAHEETVHEEESNYGVVSLGSNDFCF